MILRNGKMIRASFLVVGAAVATVVFLNLLFRQDSARSTREIQLLTEGLKQSLGGAGSLEDALKAVQGQRAFWDVQFPRREEDVIRTLKAILKEQQITLESLNTSPKTEVMGENNVAVAVDGKDCRQMAITLNFKATYKELVSFLDGLQQRLDVYFSVENLRVKKNTAEPGRLSVEITFKIYLLI